MRPQVDLAPVAPPVPAPYLRDLPSLPADLLSAMDGRRQRITPAQQRKARRLLNELKARIFAARRTFEDLHGVRIQPEPPLAN